MWTRDVRHCPSSQLKVEPPVPNCRTLKPPSRAVPSVPYALQADAYDVLGVAEDAATRVMKKRYWKLSLMIHPDKCAHPKAAEAFQSLAAAAKLLQVR